LVRILVLNSGSSSLKTALYEFETAQADQLPPPKPAFKQNIEGSSPELGSLVSRAGKVDAIGHRIVHGGDRFYSATLVTPQVRRELAKLAEIAPLHAGSEMKMIDSAVEAFGEAVPQIAVFDTAFHATLEPEAFTYAGPREWVDRDRIRRYGFHGLSHLYSSRMAAKIVGADRARRILICHLGSGASLCAVKDGKSVDTTMGYTPLEGLVMATRSGSVDPGILIYLMRHKGYRADDLDQILNHQSGLEGLAGSADMREIEARRKSGDPKAALAFDVFMHRLVREAGAMAAVLGGVDVLVFTGGVGEHSATVRDELSKRLEFLQIPSTLVIEAEEEWEIARACSRLLPF
jgi:acetate kinase